LLPRNFARRNLRESRSYPAGYNLAIQKDGDAGTVLAKAWRKTRPKAQATLDDFMEVLIYSAGLVGMHFLDLLLVLVGIPSEFTTFFHWGELGVEVAIFGSFFFRAALRALKG
jgi:hypothetical protein